MELLRFSLHGQMWTNPINVKLFEPTSSDGTAGSIGGTRFDTVIWENGLSGDLVHNDATGASGGVWLENVIPEPSTTGLFLLGAASLWGAFRRRR